MHSRSLTIHCSLLGIRHSSSQLPCFLALVAIVLRDAHPNREWRSPRATAFDAIPALAIALTLETVLAITHSDLALPRLVTMAGSGLSLFMLSTVRLMFAPVQRGTHAPGSLGLTVGQREEPQ